jgi:hypothetical protein
MDIEISRDDVIAVYRLFLARVPENEAVIDEKLSSYRTLIKLCHHFATSDEFRATVPAYAPIDWPCIDVEVEMNEHMIGTLFERR